MVPNKVCSATGPKSSISSLDDVSGRADECSGALNRLEDRISNTVDAIVGNAPPTAGEDSAKAEAPANHKDRMHNTLARMEADIAFINANLDRL